MTVTRSPDLRFKRLRDASVIAATTLPALDLDLDLGHDGARLDANDLTLELIASA
jgi:hypothetical protein